MAVSMASMGNSPLNSSQYMEENRPRKLINDEIRGIMNGLPDIHGSNNKSTEVATRSLKASILKQLTNIKITPLALENGDFQQEINRQFKASLIRPGTMVGSNATDAISAPIMQMTLNTFHTAGAAKNVTAGFEAVKELIKGSANPKNPSCTVSFKNKHLSFDDILDIKQSELIGLVASRPIVDWDILSQSELFGMDIVHPYWYNISSNVLGKRIPTPQQSHWVLRLTVNVDTMYRFKITAKELSDSIEGGSPEMITCIYSPIVWRDDVQTIVDDVGNVIEDKIKVATVYIDIFPDDAQIRDVGGLDVSIAGQENIGMIFLESELRPSLDQIRVKGIPGIENIFPIESPVWQVVENEVDTRDENYPNLWLLEYNMFRIKVSGITGENVVKLCNEVGMRVYNPTKDRVQVVVPEKTLEFIKSHPDFDRIAKIERPKDYITPGELVRYKVNKDRADAREQEQKNRKKRNRLLVEDPRKGLRFVTQVPIKKRPIYRAANFVYADTNGSNMRELMNRDDIDPDHTYSNNMYDILTILGVEAARNYLIWSLHKMFINSGQYVDIRHTMLLIDYMTFSGGVTKATFSGVRNHGAVLTTASYQQGMKTMANASLYGDFDPGNSIAASIFTGKTPDIGYDIVVTEQMKSKILQMYNAADSGEPITIDPDELEQALKNQDEIAGRADTTFGGATIPIDENDALMNAMFGTEQLPEEFFEAADIETRAREESRRRGEQSNIFNLSEIGKPKPIENEAIAVIIDDFVTSGEEIPCEPPTIEFVKIEGLEHGISTIGLPSDAPQPTPKLTQNTVQEIPVPKVGINVPQNIGIPPNLISIIQQGLSFQLAT
jgi:RNA polymerase Rpb1, domain 5